MRIVTFWSHSCVESKPSLYKPPHGPPSHHPGTDGTSAQMIIITGANYNEAESGGSGQGSTWSVDVGCHSALREPLNRVGKWRHRARRDPTNWPKSLQQWPQPLPLLCLSYIWFHWQWMRHNRSVDLLQGGVDGAIRPLSPSIALSRVTGCYSLWLSFMALARTLRKEQAPPGHHLSFPSRAPIFSLT